MGVSQIFGYAENAGEIIPEQTNSQVARMAKPSAEYTGFMVVIEAERRGARAVPIIACLAVRRLWAIWCWKQPMALLVLSIILRDERAIRGPEVTQAGGVRCTLLRRFCGP